MLQQSGINQDLIHFRLHDEVSNIGRLEKAIKDLTGTVF